MTQRGVRRQLIGAGSAIVVALTGIAAAGAAMPANGVGAAAPVAPYTAKRIISGSSFPGLAAWGLAYNPVSDELVVGDYVSKQVRRYSRAGVYLGDLKNPGGNVGGVASALSVDPRDGAIYLAITGEGRTSTDIRKYDVAGNFLFGFETTYGVTWLDVDPAGNLWVPEAFAGRKLHKYAVDDATATLTEQLLIDTGQGGAGLGVLTGVDQDGAGNVYVADRRSVHSYNPDGSWRLDITSSHLKGDLRGIAVDTELGLVYVSNALGGTIEVFGTDGTWVRSISSDGIGVDQLSDGARQLAVTPDHHIWAADYGSFRVVEFDQVGTYLRHFPSPQMPADPAGLAQARGVDVDPVTGDILVVDAWGQRALRFAPDGTLLDTHGRRGSIPPEGMNYPKAIAVDPLTRNVWISNYEGEPGVVGFDANFDSVIRKLDLPRWVSDLEVARGSLYAVERRPGAVRLVDPATGVTTKTWTSPYGYLHGIGVDPVTGNMWLTHDTKKEAYVVSPAGKLIRRIPLTGSGWGVAIRGDDVFIAEDTVHKVQIFNRKTYAAKAVFGVQGLKLGQLRGPSGIAVTPAGQVVVVEQANGRIQVFDQTPQPAPEADLPTVALTGPDPLVGDQVQVTGTAADVSGIATVEVSVLDTTTGLSFDGRRNTWVETPTWNTGIVWGPIESVNWRYTVPGTLPTRSYQVMARAVDRRGNTGDPVAIGAVVP